VFFRSLRPRFTSGGRGRHYEPYRAIIESTLRVAYAGGWPARLWARVPGATRVRTIHHRLDLSGRLERPLRVAFVSDLHLGPTTPRETLDSAFSALRAANADVLLMGGDYVFLDLHPSMAVELTERVASVPAATKLAVLGNHDLWTDTAPIERALSAGGARVLVNDAVRLPPPFEEIAILGLDEPWTGDPDPERAVSACGDAKVRLALAHSPDGAGFLKNRDVALLMCGHTHGGQIALPGERPIVLPPGPYSKRYAAGLHRVHDLSLFVSRGVGATELPIRTYASPEIALFDIR